MSRITFLLDCAGRVARDVTGHTWLTVAGVAIPSGDTDRIRQAVPAGLPKWSHSSPDQASLAIDYVDSHATAALILQIEKVNPACSIVRVRPGNIASLI